MENIFWMILVAPIGVWLGILVS